MSNKRLHDRNIWDREWYWKLPTKWKLVWNYLFDSADYAGVWVENYSLASFKLREEVTQEETQSVFGPRLVRVARDRLFLPDLVPVVYDTLLGTNNYQKSALRILEQYPIDLAPFQAGAEAVEQAILDGRVLIPNNPTISLVPPGPSEALTRAYTGPLKTNKEIGTENRNQNKIREAGLNAPRRDWPAEPTKLRERWVLDSEGNAIRRTVE